MPETIPTPPQQRSSTMTAGTGDAVELNRFKLNHPKNYLAVPLAVSASGDTDALIRDHAVNLPQRARRGAIETGLVTRDDEVTELGEAVIVTAVRNHGSVIAALEAFQSIHGSPKRFVSVFPEWQSIAERLAFQYDPTSHLVRFLRQQGPMCLHELTWVLWKHDPDLAKALFLHPSTIDQYTIECETPPTYELVTAPSCYRSETTFQFKAFLYHCGVLDSRGNDTSRLEPTQDYWRLDDQF